MAWRASPGRSWVTLHTCSPALPVLRPWDSLASQVSGWELELGSMEPLPIGVGRGASWQRGPVRYLRLLLGQMREHRGSLWSPHWTW